MTKKVSFIAAILVIMMVFSSCGADPKQGISDRAEGFMQSETASQSEISSAMTTTASSETVTFCEEDVFSETSETGPETEPEAADTSFPVVTPADKLYGSYPMKIIYPEKQETPITVKIAEVKETIYKGDVLVVEFEAKYPVFSGGNEAVIKKINGNIKEYIDGVLDEERHDVENYEISEEDVEYVMPVYGFFWQRWIYTDDFNGYNIDGCDINGNILSVYFEDYVYGAGAAHGNETPMPMLFDLRTGDRIYFSDLVGDSDGLSEVLKKALSDHQFNHGAYPYGRIDADRYAEISSSLREEEGSEEAPLEFGTDENGKYIAAFNNADERMTVLNGCAAFYLAPYEYGSYADGVRRVDVPASEVIPFLNEKGRSLFEGYVSGSIVPANVISYNDEKYFDTTEWIPDIFDEDNITEEDRGFIALFKNAGKYELEKYGIEYLD